jgi:hypothetical protein
MNGSLLQKIDSGIGLGVAYLHEHQYPNGEFCCYYASDDAMQKWCVPDSTVFPTAIIASSLLHLKKMPVASEILSKSVGFLQYQMMRGGAWNYFTKWNSLFKICPADVDDTVFASYVLRSLKINYPDNKQLLLANRNAKGLFYTWFTLRLNRSLNKNYWLLLLRELKHPITGYFFWRKNECNRSDIDAVVNANVLFYLGPDKDTEPVINYLVNIIEKGEEDDCDKWYRNPFTVYYFLSRNYRQCSTELNSVREPIISRIIHTAKENGQLGESVLDTALAVITLLHLNYKAEVVTNAIAYLLTSQATQGNWPRHLLFYGGPKRLIGWGSEELTTGFCLEALAMYRHLIIQE